MKNKWHCFNCGAEWDVAGSGSLSCPYAHSPSSSSLSVEHQPVKEEGK